ncbi:hypothetical protein U1Q18_027855 [Sarracenia purpurea var. burkii]
MLPMEVWTVAKVAGGVARWLMVLGRGTLVVDEGGEGRRCDRRTKESPLMDLRRVDSTIASVEGVRPALMAGGGLVMEVVALREFG